MSKLWSKRGETSKQSLQKRKKSSSNRENCDKECFYLK